MDYNALLVTVIAEKQQEVLNLRVQVEQLTAESGQTEKIQKEFADKERASAQEVKSLREEITRLQQAN